MIFNGLAIYFYVGRNCNPWFLQEIFKTQDFAHLDRHLSEDEMFAGYE